MEPILHMLTLAKLITFKNCIWPQFP